MKLFVDLDNTLADFDAGYEAVFGYRPCKIQDNADWDAVRRTKDFYLNLPPMPDLDILWDYIGQLKPIVLTGVPSSVPEAPANKIAWVRKNLGPDVEVRCCLSREKFKHCQPGDVICDDWEKHMHLWLSAGGRWITHVSAEQTIDELWKLGIGL